MNLASIETENKHTLFKKTTINDAAKAIRDKSTEVVNNHYAGETVEEQRFRNKGIANTLYQIVGQS